MGENIKWSKIPYFGKGKASSLEEALTSGRYAEGLDKALFYFATDTKQWILVDVDKSVHTITSSDGGLDIDGSVKRLNTLPSVIDGDTETIYLVGDRMYQFDGQRYIAADERIGVLPPGLTVSEYIATTREDVLDTARQFIDEAMELHMVMGGE